MEPADGTAAGHRGPDGRYLVAGSHVRWTLCILVSHVWERLTHAGVVKRVFQGTRPDAMWN